LTVAVTAALLVVDPESLHRRARWIQPTLYSAGHSVAPTAGGCLSPSCRAATIPIVSYLRVRAPGFMDGGMRKGPRSFRLWIPVIATLAAVPDNATATPRHVHVHVHARVTLTLHRGRSHRLCSMVGLVGDGLDHGLPHLQSHVLGLSDTRTHIDAVFGTPFSHSLPS
jgi:hypothetical protein